MELVRIPATVSTEYKDLFGTLPDEVLIEILKETLRASQAEMSGAVCYWNLHEVQFHKLRRISKQVARLFPTAFYEACKFDFTPPKGEFFRPLVLPPVIHRQFLRRLRMDFHLGDTFYVSNPFTSPHQQSSLTHVYELFRYFKDARRLRDLTTEVFGFTKLAELEIYLITKFRDADNIERTLAVYEAAGLTVCARKVTITAAPAAQSVFHLHPMPANPQVTEQHWHDRLVAAITIKDIVAEPKN